MIPYFSTFFKDFSNFISLIIYLTIHALVTEVKKAQHCNYKKIYFMLVTFRSF